MRAGRPEKPCRRRSTHRMLLLLLLSAAAGSSSATGAALRDAGRSQRCVQHTTRGGTLPAQVNHDYGRPLDTIPWMQALQWVASKSSDRNVSLPAADADDRRKYCPLLPFTEYAGIGSWERMRDGQVAYEPTGCLLRRMSGDAARQCLAGKYIAFAGDSVTRYHYLALAYFLSQNKYLPRYHNETVPSLVRVARMGRVRARVGRMGRPR